MAPLIIPIFIAHQGCPHRCLFCDQHTITGHAGGADQEVTPEAVNDIIAQWLQRPSKEDKAGVQVAFYGGSFTALPKQSQRKLLGSVQPYLEAGQVDTIRISTRPDYVDDAIINLLQEYAITIVELGIQSFNQEVLDASGRGHSVQQAEKAVNLLKKNGFTVGVQLMCGLPQDNVARLAATARKTAALAPDFVRIYPVLVIKGSGLEKIFRKGNYRPLSLARAIALSGRMKTIFDQHNIRVVRMGLQTSEELTEKVVAGPYHPAFGELVMARLFFKKSRKALRAKKDMRQRHLSIAAADESVFRGPGNVSTKRLATLGLLQGVEFVFDKNQPRNTVRIF